MAQIGAGKIPAGVAFTCLIQRSRIAGEVHPLDVEPTMRRKQRAVARIACRNDAVEHIQAGTHGLDDILWPAHAHQVARPILRQQAGRGSGNGVQHRLPLTDTEPSNSESFKRHLPHFIDTPTTEIFVHTALYDAEQQLIFFLRALRQRSAHRMVRCEELDT